MSQEKFVHDLINSLTMVSGEITLIIKKSDRLSKEDILKKVDKASFNLEKAFEIIKNEIDKN
ncbi:MAG: hypothetical protein HOE90_02765 [Bacteriovoracaceae bacterium]|jgi:hypothetical protein|nr:hypothetical protein [Bacteriovoracaceae bacterium]